MTKYCPQCNGELRQRENVEEYTCRSCNRRFRASVVDRIESFKRVADGGGPLAEITETALEGYNE
jgi:ribosomal protein L37AE/L43A